MKRSGPSLLLLMSLLSGITLSATATPPASTTTAPAVASMAMPSAAQPAQAPANAQTQPAANVPALPTRGMDMANVEHIYGAPLEKLAPVPVKGTRMHPPITRWIYPTFVVYFEYNQVVHAVTKAHPFKDSTDDQG
jgi:hypothetical protein